MNRIVSFILIFSLIVGEKISAQSIESKGQSFTFDPEDYSYLNLNNISTVFFNNGISDIDTSQMNSGFEFPKGSGKTAVFTSGLLWGLLTPGFPQYPSIGGSAYRSGLQPGKILNSGLPPSQLTAEDLNAAHVRIYRVRPDVYPGGPPVDLSVEAAIEGKSVSEIRTQYETDWIEWRATDGAPFDDKDGDGLYNPVIDVPGIKGALQTIWFVANDLDPLLTQNLYGSDPIGVEYQATFWEYSDGSFLDNLFFRKYKLINKSNADFQDMYLCMWSDVDIGHAQDDFSGCDSLLNIGFNYNAYNYDEMYYPSPPPAAGFKLLQGPADSLNNYLPMTAFFYFRQPEDIILPPYPNYYPYYYYNLMRGRIRTTGEPFINPITGSPTSYCLSGDPLTGDGWMDGLLLPPGDRRIGLSSGPFNMAPSDTQEVIIAEIAALGFDRLDSYKKFKFYAGMVQNAYETGYYQNFEPKPPVPVVNVDESEHYIKLNWGKDEQSVEQIENFDQESYAFQGYNIYQLNSTFPTKENSVRIATFDLADGITEIPGIVMDPETGQPVEGTVHYGSDSGIERTISINHDYINNSHLVIGKKYYYAVTAYTYNPDPQAFSNNSESLLKTVEVVFYETLPGPSYGDTISVTHESGNGEGKIYITVTDPVNLTGDDYEVYFDSVTYYRNEFGEWVPLHKGRNKINGDDPDTLTGSTIDIGAIYGSEAGTVELFCVLNLVSPSFDWADGITMTFSAGVTILEAPPFETGNTSNEGPIVPQIVGNTVIMGNVDHEYTQNGPFIGGEDWTIIVQAEAPFSVDWVIFDDGYSGGPVDAEGTTIIEEIGYEFKFQNEWNLRNLTTQDTLLQHQTVIMGYDLYSGEYVGDPEVEGFKISLDVNYDSPVSIGNLELNGEPLEVNDFSADYRITDFTYYSYPDATAETTLPLYGGAGGTTILSDLQQDYELRWNGVTSDTIINGRNVVITKYGGSIATLFGASSYSLADHPLNPNPGVEQPFTIRIPLEVWNTSKNEQVNLLVWDRTGDILADSFFVWNIYNRTYAWIVNTQFNSNVIDPTSQVVADSATWNWVFYKSIFTTGDVIKVTYNDPIVVRDDVFTFTTPEAPDTSYFIPTTYYLFQNYPNPFNPGTKIRFYIPEQSLVKLDIYDILGQKVAQLINEELPSNTYEVEFNGSAFASGVYIYVLNIPDKFFEAKKMILMK